MKDYNQMAQDVFRRRDEYLAMKEKKKAILLKAGVPLCSLVLVALLGLTLWRGEMPEIPVAPVTPTIVQTDSTVNNATIIQNQTINEEPTKPVANALPQDPTEPTNQYTPPVQTTPVDKPGSDSGNKYPESATGTEDNAVTRPPDWIVPDDTYPLVDPTEPYMPLPTDSWEDDYTYPCVEETLATHPPLPQDKPSVETTLPAEPTPTEPTEPTEPSTGPVEITVGGKKYTAQTGDMVTYTAELRADSLIETLSVVIECGDELQVVKYVDPETEEASSIHYPNLAGGSDKLNYQCGINKENGNKRLRFLSVKYGGFEFRKQKVLATFDFMVKAPGESEILLYIETLTGFDGNEILERNIEEYLTVTPASEVKPPAEKNPTENEPEVEPFTYPDESDDGELLIHCDGRTYSADVGQRITYFVELEAEEKFVNFNFELNYGEGILDIYPPKEIENGITAEEISAPNLPGIIIAYNEFHPNYIQKNDCVKANGSYLRRYNFTKRKVFIQLDFIVLTPGEVSFDLIFKEMSIDSSRSYFDAGEQLVFDGIEIYEYVIVN